METSLLILAAGMGSRFGGLKQIAPIGPNGETILDFSIYDAIEAGFNEIVFIIKKEIEEDFKEVIGKRWEGKIKITYTFQSNDKVPSFFDSSKRQKPLGTAHAVLCAKDALDKPFAVINADDFYGKNSFKLVHDFLVNNENDNCLIGFKLLNTLSDNGSVSRGVCEVENGNLKSVTECTAITKDSDYDMNSTVSMNMWGLNPSLLEDMEKYFHDFLSNIKNVEKDECYLPLFIDTQIKEKDLKVKVLQSDEKWYGMTYKEDIDGVKEAIKLLVDKGYYDGI
ncbi:MAG: nucleotidyltransferase [Ruminococcaceae bacterium]|nr:nucleotidyltransferase [Oscillospiraceae bacterium]